MTADAILRHVVAAVWLALAAMKLEMLASDTPGAGTIVWPLWIHATVAGLETLIAMALWWRHRLGWVASMGLCTALLCVAVLTQPTACGCFGRLPANWRIAAGTAAALGALSCLGLLRSHPRSLEARGG